MQEKASKSQKLAYNIHETCEALGISRNSFYIEVNAGRLKAKRVGHRMIITRQAIESWLEALPDNETFKKAQAEG